MLLPSEKERIEKACKFINDLIGMFDYTAVPEMLKAAEKAVLDEMKKRGGAGFGSDGIKGNMATKHPEFHSKVPIGAGTRRNFNAGDPDFNRSVVIYDSTISS